MNGYVNETEQNSLGEKLDRSIIIMVIFYKVNLYFIQRHHEFINLLNY